jgi:heme oxygenase
MRYLAFFIAAESRRVTLNCFPGHSLMPDISLLSADTGFIPDDLPRLHLVTDKWSCLGMLYVLHGARFGAKLMQTNLCARFPELPHHYFAQEQTPSQWRLIVMQMERASQSPLQIDALAQSAAETYALFDQWMSRPA